MPCPGAAHDGLIDAYHGAMSTYDATETRSVAVSRCSSICWWTKEVLITGWVSASTSGRYQDRYPSQPGML